jgi:hypothetical protein
MVKQLPIGVSDFKDVRVGNYTYIDKSMFIKELIDAGPSKVTIIPRPRRFGKTLNMTMLKYFFEKQEANKSYRHLFDGLEIAKSTACMQHQGQYPVIFLTFKDIKSDTWQECYDKLKQCIRTEFQRHKYLYTSVALDELEKKSFYSILDDTASQAAFENSIKNVSYYLQKHYDVKPIILIDEYDSPVHAGFLYNYYDKIISFMRGLLCGGLKDNPNLAYGVVTGILRVAKESIFSGMNNLSVHTMLSAHYTNRFGFTEQEVAGILAAYHLLQKFDEVCAWYNGYRMGQPKDDGTFTTVYNPWSMLNFINEKGTFGTYWVNTSDNRLIQELVRKASADVKKDFELILAKKPVNETINEDIVFPSIYSDSTALWSFLIFSGYLTWQARERMQVKCKADLIVPNNEVLDCLKTLIDRWFTELMGSGTYQDMLEALRQADVAAFKRYFQQSIVDHMSFFDISGKTPERVYHAYVLGLLVGLDATHEVKSNRESGIGRYDVCLIPRDSSKSATIIEFKVFNPEKDSDMKIAAQSALAQIEAQQYEAELLSRGIRHIVKLAIVFDGKKTLVASK